MRHHRFVTTSALALIALIAAACGTPGSSASPSASPGSSATPSAPTSPSSSPAPSGSPAGSVTSPAQAAALVFASDPRFARMGPLLPDLIGQSTWYEASETAGGYSVRITTGSGDCQAGCIDRHTWNFLVESDGTIDLVGEEGDDIDLEPVDGGDAPAVVTFALLAGPTCPVETVPADPNCAPRPVANAEIVLRDPAGAEVDRARSNDEGVVAFEVAPGAYYAEPQPVEGLMGIADPVAFAVVGSDITGLTLSYDTGIR